MQEADFLFVIAEVGIALAGFATIVVAFSQRFRGQQALAASTRLDSMLRCGLLGVLGALLPYIPHQIGLTQEAVWRVSFVGLGLGWLAYFIYRMRAARPAGGVHIMRWTNRIAMFVVHPVGIVVCVLGVLGLLGTHAGSVFLGLLFVLLGLSANLFLQLVNDLLGSSTAQQGDEADVEQLGSSLRCIVWRQPFEARRRRRRYSTPLIADPLGGPGGDAWATLVK